MAKPRGTDGSLLASLPWTLVALAVALLPHIQFLPVWISAAFFVCGAWRYIIEKRRRPLPSTWFRALLALVCFLGVLATYSSISGVGPGSALLAIMASLKLLETRKRRDQFVLLFISIFLVMSSLLREQFLWSLPYLLGSVVLIMTAWLRMSAVEREPARQTIRTGLRLVLYAAPLAIAMWVFFPRIATPFWAIPIDTSRATSGLSDTMSPGDISSLSMSDEVAFRVSFDGAVPEGRQRYWRGLVLTHFDGRTWSGSDPGRGALASEQLEVSGDPVSYQVTIEPTRQQWVFALDMPVTWDLAHTFMGPQQQLARSQPIDQRTVYRATSYPDYQTKVELNSFLRQRYVAITANNAGTTMLARSMRDAVETDEQFIAAVLLKFHEEEFYYTLEPPPLGSDPIDRFLFETRQGFCEHYASAFAVMMRAAGIPSRVVLGYQGGEINPLGGHMIVRQSDAHAWTEVWLDGAGWRRVDPTAAVAPERIEAGISGAMFDAIGASWGLTAPSAILHRIALTFDAIDAKWNEWILGYGPDNQNRFMEWLGMDDPNWRKLMWTLLGSVIGLILLISFLLSLRYRPPPRDRAAILYERFVKKTGVDKKIGETPTIFAARAEEETDISVTAIQEITATYLHVRYGHSGADGLQRLESAVSSLA